MPQQDGGPRRRDRGPEDDAGERDVSGSLPRTYLVAAHLVEAITDQAARDEENYRRGWHDCARFTRAMFDHGVDVGRAQVLNEIEAAEAETNRRLSALALAPSFADLEARRYPGRTPAQLRALRKRGAA